jgi:hypothetical protein
MSASNPEQRIDALQHRVDVQREELRIAVDDLEVAARRTVDVRHWVETKPVVCVAAAFAFGFWLGGRR